MLSRTDINLYRGRPQRDLHRCPGVPADGSEVTVTIEDQRPPGRATVSPASLTFTADNWNTAQTVTITSDGRRQLPPPLAGAQAQVATGADYGASAVGVAAP